jgi:hypothetical protein
MIKCNRSGFVTITTIWLLSEQSFDSMIMAVFDNNVIFH